MRRTQLYSLILPLLCALTSGCRTPGTSNTDAERAAAPEPESTPKLAPSVATPGDPPERVAVSTTAVNELEVAFKQAIDRAGPAVVSIYTTRTLRSMPMSPFGDPLLDQFFGLPPGRFRARSSPNAGSAAASSSTRTGGS